MYSLIDTVPGALRDLMSVPEPGTSVGWSQRWDLHCGNSAWPGGHRSRPTLDLDLNQSRPWTDLGSNFSLSPTRDLLTRDLIFLSFFFFLLIYNVRQIKAQTTSGCEVLIRPESWGPHSVPDQLLFLFHPLRLLGTRVGTGVRALLWLWVKSGCKSQARLSEMVVGAG